MVKKRFSVRVHQRQLKNSVGRWIENSLEVFKGKKRDKKLSDSEVPIWLLDGFTGILALMIYNFILYLMDISRVGGLIGAIEDTMGYFGLNSFLDLGLSPLGMSIGLVVVFGFSFGLGVLISDWVRGKNGGRVV